ncbi:MAG: ABC transporter permease, partial [Planctomycetota bacterium]
QIPKQPIVEELEKQYDVEEVDPSRPIALDSYDVLFVVQPSSLNPQQLPNVVEAIKSGVPTAIFEDPFPAFYRGITGTGEPKQPQGNPMMGQQPPEPKGDIQSLWDTLGLIVPNDLFMGAPNPDIVWQQYNPHPKLRYLMNANDQWLFLLESPEEGLDFLSEDSPISAGLRELMFLYAGSVQADSKRQDLNITELVRTRGEVSGLVSYQDVRMNAGQPDDNVLLQKQGKATGSNVLAVYVESVAGSASEARNEESAEDDGAADDTNEEGDEAAGSEEETAPSENKPIRAVYVADVDYMHPFFSENRKRPDRFDLDLRDQNITFVLNIVDVLAGEVDYPAIRSHEPQHITLGLFEDQAEIYRQAAFEKQQDLQNEFNTEKDAAEEAMQEKMNEFRDQLEKLQKERITDATKREKLLNIQQQAQIAQQVEERRKNNKLRKFEKKRDIAIRDSQQDSDNAIRKIQSSYKGWAVALPPIPPLLVGAGVFVTRRVREREGISKSRLK